MSSASPLLRRAIAALAAIAVLTAFCLAIIVAYSRNASRRAASEMHVVFRAQAPLLDQAEKREQQRHIVLRKDLAGISKAERAAKTPAEIAKRLPTAFPLCRARSGPLSRLALPTLLRLRPSLPCRRRISNRCSIASKIAAPVRNNLPPPNRTSATSAPKCPRLRLNAMPP